MHLLKAQAGGIVDGTEPVDLEQTPGDIVVLTAADTEIAALAAAKADLADAVPSLRLASLLQLTHPYSVDLHITRTLAHARLVILRLLGGPGYWQYGLDELTRICRGNDILLAVIPGDARPDPALMAYCTLPAGDCNRLWAYLVEGGADNMRGFLRYTAALLEHSPRPEPALPLAKVAPYWPNALVADLATLQQAWQPGAPVAAIVFYRALMQSGDTAPIEALVSALQNEGLNPLPVFVTSLKDPVAADGLARLFAEAPPDIVLNLTGFAVSAPSSEWQGTVLDANDVPVLQVVLAGMTEESWREDPRGLGARDIAMNVALPEIDGRILSRAISFKTARRFDGTTQTGIVRHAPRPDRVAYVAALACNWVRLHHAQPSERNIALILANYPSSDGRIANGVGLDTPASAIEVMQAMLEAGYRVADIPERDTALIAALTEGPTNANPERGASAIILPRADYLATFQNLPQSLQEAVNKRWGPPDADRLYRPAQDGFAISCRRFGGLVVGVQPARGYDIDAKQTHHDPDLVPPHGYFAFYIWLREAFGAHAIVHLGKHGNLEWLPGKALALSDICYPEVALGPLPHIAPFIANDPGEGTQTKRRTSAVIVDHLTPPLARAETYGPLKNLETLVDEYYEASGVDPRRLKLLGSKIIDVARGLKLDKDCGIAPSDCPDTALQKLDNFLCELKEMQIRHGLHVFGRTPEDGVLVDLLLALTRVPRGDGQEGNASLIRALAVDLDLPAFDPLDCNMATPWCALRPVPLRDMSKDTWRSQGDTVERLELLAHDLIAGKRAADPSWTNTNAVLNHIETTVRPRVVQCGKAEIGGLLRALDGRFVPPGPSGAPTRGRLDVLPTGRNFFSLDSRTVPTQAAWDLGRLSAERLLIHYRQEHGEWPKTLGLSAWGTSNMRTGGDDIAQALALIGAKPLWDAGSRRVTGFEVIPLHVLKRPRVDVVFRISGFFRDAFPAQIDLLESALSAVAVLDEPEDANPLVAKQHARQAANGHATEDAPPAPRIFGTKPGGYGAGLQHLIESGAWETRAELGTAYLQWGGYAYGAGRQGEKAHEAFATRIGELDAVVQNQDAREFDLLDSDEFSHFEGGMAAAAEHVSGRTPSIYHNDHSRPESPKVRLLEEEIARVVRGRAANPKWITAMRQHGYKGAAEMAQTVGNLLAFAATTNAASDHQFELLFEAYLIDPANRAFLQDVNAEALKDMARHFLEAETRSFWQPRRNSAHDFLIGLSAQGEEQGVAP